MIISLVNFALSLPLYFNFDISTYKYQFGEHIPWIPGFKINYTLGVDGISLLLVLLSTLLDAHLYPGLLEIHRETGQRISLLPPFD